MMSGMDALAGMGAREALGEIKEAAMTELPPIIERLDALYADHHAWDEFCNVMEDGYPELRTLLVDALRENKRYRKALEELTDGNGIYYIAQEMAFAPNIADGWPDVIIAPHSHAGRLVKRDARGALGGNDD